MDSECIIKSPFTDCDIPRVPIHKAWFEKFEEYGDRIALIDGDTNQQFTYHDVLNKSKRLGCGLSKLGVKKADLVALFSYNSVDWLFMFYGVLFSGATVTTINPLYTKYELAHQLKDSGAKYLYTTDDLLSTCKEAIRDLEEFNGIICKGCNDPDFVNYSDLECSDETVINLLNKQDFNVCDDVAIVPYSSGTTGFPKGVMLTHFNILANCAQLGHLDMNNPTDQKNDQQSTYMCVLPFYHMYGMLLNLGVTVSGDKLVILQKFEPEKFLSSIQEYKINVLPLVPPLVVFLTKDKRVNDYNLESVQHITSGAAPLSQELETSLKQRLNVSNMKQAYGMTETTTAACAHSAKRPSRGGSCGFLLPNTEAKICTNICMLNGFNVVNIDTKTTVSSNQSGELWLRGPQIMKGYINNVEATKNVIDNDGFLHTGDIAYCDEDGYFFIVDRLKELIKVKGFQVAPAELESILLLHPYIKDAAVIGIEDDRSGEIPLAYVVPEENVVLTEATIQDFFNERVAPFKRLTGGINFTREIPRLPSGKILRRKLKEKAVAKQSGHSSK